MTALHGAGPQTAGMLRIQKGQDERHIWPVHLSGWLALGWRVAGAREPASPDGLAAVEASYAAAGISTTVDPEPPMEAGAQPASTRSKRGRKGKEEVNQAAPADAPPLSQSASAEAEETPITALPDDLFDDSLI